MVGVKPTPVTVRPSQWWGYIPNFDYAAAWSAAEAHRDALTGVAVVQFHPDYDGDLITFPGGDYAPARAAAQGLAIVPVIANSYPNGWNREVIAHVLIATFLTALKGFRVGWGKLERTGVTLGPVATPTPSSG